MDSTYHALRQIPDNIDHRYQAGDVLVLFGELFQRGYANGLVEAAQARGLRIVRTTVGRRDKDGGLRPLLTEEITDATDFINTPLEAGFDLEVDDEGFSPVDRLKEVKLSDWESVMLSETSLLQSRQRGRERFQRHLRSYLEKLETLIPPGKKVLFAHLMAGGVPRAKIVLPLMNRSVKGTGDRFLASEKFWSSSIGRLCQMNFAEVTANTFDLLIKESSSLREKIKASGGDVCYTAYGYHGTEVFFGGKMQWQSYTPYLQGWAKIELENFARNHARQGIKATVYNCPEILTNSSSIFQGVEIPLYPLLKVLQTKAHGNSNLSKKVQELEQACIRVLKEGTRLEQMLDWCDQALTHDQVKANFDYKFWPQHNSFDQLQVILKTSDLLIEQHQDHRNLMTAPLSEVVLKSCGEAMLRDSLKPQAPVSWINHDLVADLWLRS